MIDTDKYEGHSEGSWEWVIPEWGDDHIHDSEGNLIAQVTNIDEMQMNARLIADAPLLLAEVKRLREENKELRKFVENIEWGLDEINNAHKEIKDKTKTNLI